MVATTRLGEGVGFIRISSTPSPLSSATASIPRQAPHRGSVRKAAPLVATVGKPELHIAGNAEGNLVRSVIGRDSS